MKKYNVGILGAGFIADYHIQALMELSTVNVTGICDKDTFKSKTLAKNFGIPNVFDSLDQMLESDIDCIHVLVPPDLHYPLTKIILESGKHVFLEKPMAEKPSECQELSKLANKKGLILGINHNFLFSESFTELTDKLRKGFLGRPDDLNINWYSELGFLKHGPFNIWMLKNPTNLLMEIGSHTLAFARCLVNEIHWQSVSITDKVSLPGNNETFRKLNIIGFNDETSIRINISFKPGYIDKSVTIKGTSGIVKCDYENDFFIIQKSTNHSMLCESYFLGKELSKQYSKNSRKQLLRNLTNTLKKSVSSTPFGSSIYNSISTFYGNLSKGVVDDRHNPNFGALIIDDCKILSELADFDKQFVQQEFTPSPLQTKKPADILVIGGTGFIGRELVSELIKQGHSIRIHTRDINKAKILFDKMPVELVTGKLNDSNDLNSIFDGIDIAYDLAKYEGHKWQEYLDNDVAVTRMIGEKAAENNVSHFIYTGTIDSYYSADESVTITNDTPLDAKIDSRNLYARSKAYCERELQRLQREAGLNLTIVRPGIVIGKGMPPAHWGVGKWDGQNYVEFWGNGNNKLPFVLVEDVAKALSKIIEVDDDLVNGKIFNICDEPFLSAREYVDIVSELSGIKIDARPTPILKHYAIDMLKNMVKYIIHHPNRRFPTYRDWDSRAHRSHYDCTATRQILKWHPAGTPDLIIENGIKKSVQEMLR